jgi:hypothetical protein
MHPKHMIQLTANTFARHGRHGDQDGQAQQVRRPARKLVEGSWMRVESLPKLAPASGSCALTR